jgi:hypothetical protein
MGLIKRTKRLILIVIAAVAFAYLIEKLPNFLGLYISYGLDSSVLQFAGVFLGLLLTAYAIFFGVVPAIEPELLKANAFKTINRVFLLGIIFNVIIMIISLFIFFQIWLVFLVLFWSLYLVEFIYRLFEEVRAERTN